MTIIANYSNGAGPKSAEAAPEAPAQPSVLNPDVFHETVEEMGRDFVERIADRLLTETETLLPQLDAFVLSGSLAEAAKAAHKTAGAAAAIGLAGLHGALVRCEKAALANDAETAAKELVTARDVLPRTVRELRENGISVALAGVE